MPLKIFKILYRSNFQFTITGTSDVSGKGAQGKTGKTITDFLLFAVRQPSVTPAPKRLNSGLEKSSPESSESPVRLCLTQPLPLPTLASQNPPNDNVDDSKSNLNHFCFSQPVVLDDLLLSSQLHVSQAARYVDTLAN